jgi:hypothetical protein
MSPVVAAAQADGLTRAVKHKGEDSEAHESHLKLANVGSATSNAAHSESHASSSGNGGGGGGAGHSGSRH